MADDEEAVEHAERHCWHSKAIHGRNASRWFRRKASQRLARSGSLRARFLQRGIVLSERSKPRMREFPCKSSGHSTPQVFGARQNAQVIAAVLSSRFQESRKMQSG